MRTGIARGRGTARSSAWLRGPLACVLLLTGCASATVIRLPKAGPHPTCITPAVEQDVAVALSISGGGSRAALFGASVLEALAQVRTPEGRSLMEQVSYISSVSGGSLTTGYYAMNKPPRETPILGPDGAMTEAYQTFFAGFKAKLNQDFESALIWRQIGSFRFILNSALAARSLSEVLEERLLGPGTMGDLGAREMRGDSPRVIFNTTLYNSGRRFLITTLPPDASRYDFFADMDRSLASRGLAYTFPPIVKRRWESLLPVTPLDLQIDPCAIRVPGAVAASASFPPLVGPITFAVGDEEHYWHFGDGGLYDNLGLETLLFLFLKQLQERQVRRALILSFDSGYPFSVGDRLLGRRKEPWTLFTYDFSRIPSIMEERASAYWTLFFRSLQAEGVFPDNATVRVVFFRHIDAQWKADLSDLPEACRTVRPALTSPEEVRDRIAEIPTRFVVNSECDRQLLAVAAAKVVAQHRQEIEDFLAGRPTPEGSVR
jgi:predicted acylesterase/phospholipase RssA